MHPIDECLDRLKRAGWSVGHAAFGSTWQVDGTNGEGTCLAGLFTSCTLFRTDEVAENPGDFAAYT